jgi:hypothetical protein
MISICIGADLDRVLRLIEVAPSRYAKAIICSPFIDGATSDRIHCLQQSASRFGCGIRIITSGGSASSLQPISLAGFRNVRSRNLILVPHLHAKVYLAIGRRFRDSWVLVTSANATRAALEENVELGLLIHATSPEGGRIVEEVHWFLEKLTRFAKES